MNNQILLELKQKDATKSNANGDYMVNLPRQIDIEQGDSIILNSAFIDTVATTSDNINLAEDLELTFQFGYYMINALANATNNMRYFANYSDDAVPQGSLPINELEDGKPYILCKKASAGDIPNYIVVQIIEFSYNDTGQDLIGQEVDYQYENLDGVTVKGKTTTPYQNHYHTIDPVKLDINVVAKKGTFTITNEKALSKYYKYKGITKQSPIEENDFEVYTKSRTITIPKGIYTRPQLATIINDKMSVNNISSTPLESTTPVNNPLLFNTTTINSNPLSTANQKYYFVDLDTHKNMFYCANNYWCGTSQFDLEYDTTEQKFYFNYLHTPAYNASGDIYAGFTTDKRIHTKTEHGGFGAYGGIFFTSITDNQGNNFFTEGLGFDFDNELIVNLHNETYSKLKIGDVSTSSPTAPNPAGYEYEGKYPNIKLEPSVHYTSGYIGLDTAVIKTNLFNQITGTASIQSTTTSTFTIYASNSISLSGENTPYFLIDINIPFINDLITRQKDRKTIYAIVSKYYSLDSYTSKEGSTILYTHVGEPTQLSSLTVRILNPDYTLSSDIGDDNTVFLQVNKAPKQIKN